MLQILWFFEEESPKFEFLDKNLENILGFYAWFN
jgi:hypothetical protein